MPSKKVKTIFNVLGITALGATLTTCVAMGVSMHLVSKDEQRLADLETQRQEEYTKEHFLDATCVGTIDTHNNCTYALNSELQTFIETLETPPPTCEKVHPSNGDLTLFFQCIATLTVNDNELSPEQLKEALRINSEAGKAIDRRLITVEFI